MAEQRDCSAQRQKYHNEMKSVCVSVRSIFMSKNQ